MKTKILIVAITLFVVAGVLLSIALLGPSILSRSAGIGAPVNTTPVSQTGENAIQRENSLPGSPGWRIPVNKESTTQIQAYASATSVTPGGKINFYVSTQLDSTKYQIDVYRLGWYQGVGARDMHTEKNLVGHAQGYYDANAGTLQNCVTTCFFGTQSFPGLVEAKWNNPYTLTVGADWTSGIYLAKFTDANGWETYAPFDVSPPNQSSTYIAVTPDTTYAARNTWGGGSFYQTQAALAGKFPANAFGGDGHVARVSFDRPYASGSGAADTLLYVIQMVRWMERNGYDVSYMSDVDLHEHPDWLLTHKAYISLGDDEYWTRQMYDAVEAGRNKGLGLAFMGANAIYWQMRFEPSSSGVADRTVVCYRVSSPNTLHLDPNYQAPTFFVKPDNTKSAITAMWSDPVNNRPEQALVGSMHSDLTTIYRPGYPWQVSKTTDPNSILLKGTGLTPGQSYGCGLVGSEWNSVNPKFPSPTNYHTLSESPVYSDVTRSSIPTSNTTYYVASSGALVFATGSFFFSSAVDSYRPPDMQQQGMSPTKYCGLRNTNSVPDLKSVPGMGSADTIIPGMQTLMQNVMAQLVVKHTPNS
ncbi:MAG TPA: N,N-dimethylformamidase beta subunit family domain-containing protein [Ktedonobacteraceae bacterium]|nr:N,N-dimethylformamidase beta subunit family domain-containing protein [Ktedonobacteraceae bacterium]